MSRRNGILGLTLSLAVLLLTVVAITGAGPSLPGPPVREWLGVGEGPLPQPCEPNPKLVHEAPGEPAAGRWRVEPDAPVDSPEAGSATVGKYIYMVGGQSPEGAEATVLRFDPRTGEYRRETDAPVTVDHPVVAAYRGELILASGFVGGSEPTNRAWAYSPDSGRWRELPPMRVARGGAAGAVSGGRLYVAGGTTAFGSENEPIQSLETYDFATGRWLRGPDMPTARHHFGAAAAGGKLYFAGGRQPSNQSLDTFERFDPATGRWARLAPVPIGTGAPGVALIAGRVVVTGGGRDPLDPEGSGGWILRAAFSYDLATGRWSRLPDMHRPRHGHSAAAASGRVYVFRGTPCPGYGRTASAESLRVP